MAHIDYYFSTLSPYAYLAGTRLEEIAAKHGKSSELQTARPAGALFMRTGGQLAQGSSPESSISPTARRNCRARQRRPRLPLNMKPALWPMNAAPSCYAIIAAIA